MCMINCASITDYCIGLGDSFLFLGGGALKKQNVPQYNAFIETNLWISKWLIGNHLNEAKSVYLEGIRILSFGF